MSWQRALNEVQGLLTQGGVPTNHAQDIVARITFALSDYYDSRQSQGNSQDFSNNDSATQSGAFQRAFRSPESSRTGEDGQTGKDGRYAWARGARGKDGEEGEAGQDGSGQDGQNGAPGGGGGGGFSIKSVPCSDLKQKLKDCGIKTGEGCEGCDKCNPKCCPGYGGTGMLNGQSLCAVVDAQARMLKKIRERLDDAEDRLDKIEKLLKDTIDCS
jgi:hypothetical protein